MKRVHHHCCTQCLVGGARAALYLPLLVRVLCARHYKHTSVPADLLCVCTALSGMGSKHEANVIQYFTGCWLTAMIYCSLISCTIELRCFQHHSWRSCHRCEMPGNLQGAVSLAEHELPCVLRCANMSPPHIRTPFEESRRNTKPCYRCKCLDSFALSVKLAYFFVF